MEVKMIRLDDINPYNGCHPKDPARWPEVESKFTQPDQSKKHHEEGIQKVINGLLRGGEIRPIAIRKTAIVYEGLERKYELMDGFIRYIGYSRSGIVEIPAIEFEPPKATPGMQQGQSMWIKEPEEKKIDITSKINFKESKKEKQEEATQLKMNQLKKKRTRFLK